MRSYGPSGGFAGGLQTIFDVVEGVALGCAVPFFIRVRSGANGAAPAISNVVTIPITADGSPCGDRHGLPNGVVRDLFAGKPYRKMTATIVESKALSGDTFFPGGFSTLRGFEFRDSNYGPPAALGTCEYLWSPEIFQTSLIPQRLKLFGSYSLDLRWATIQHEVTSGFTSFVTFDFPAANSITDGPYSYSTSTDFTVDGRAFPIEGNGNYTRGAGRLKDLVDIELSRAYRDKGFVSFGQVIDAVIDSGAAGDGLVVNYQLSASDGPFGIHTIDCFASGDPSDLRIRRDIYAGQQETMFRRFFPMKAEDAFLWVSFRNLDTNLTERTGGPVNATEEVFEALSTFTFTPDNYVRALGN